MLYQFAGAPVSQSLPMYLQISERLIREIAAGTLADGSRLPPEREMAAQLGTSVGTVRKALADLEAKGLLSRVQGSGNYVRQRPDVTSIYGFFRLETLAGGGLPTARNIDVGMHPSPDIAPPDWPAGPAWRLRRLRLLDDLPVAAEEIWLAPPHQLGPREAGASLYRVYRERLGLIVTRVEDRIGLGPAPGWMPQGTGLAPGDPAPLVTRRAFAGGAQIEVSRTWFDPDRAAYVSRVGKG